MYQFCKYVVVISLLSYWLFQQMLNAEQIQLNLLVIDNQTAYTTTLALFALFASAIAVAGARCIAVPILFNK